MTAMLFTACGSKSNEDVATTGNETVGDTAAETQNESSTEESTASNDVTVTFELCSYNSDQTGAYICKYMLDGADQIDVLEIPEEYDGYQILGIAGSLAGDAAKKIIVNSSNITELGDNVFTCSQNLEEAEIVGVSSIGIESFYQCSNLKKVVLSEGLTTLGDGAFYDCRQLAELHLPASLSKDTTNFSNLGLNNPETTVIYTPAGSDAEAWANENGFKVVNE